MDYLGEDADTRQAIVGIAMEYGLVTNYTSMIVVREEVFKELAIDRTNATRIEKEQQARAHRSINPIQDNRQDTQQPAFNTPRAYPSGSGSGGGAISGWTLIFLTPLLLLRRRSLRKSGIS
jgi:Ca-activated chloride channel family protein